MNLHFTSPSVGSDVWIVKEDKILGTGAVVGFDGQDRLSVMLKDAAANDLLPLTTDDLKSIGYGYLFIGYDANTCDLHRNQAIVDLIKDDSPLIGTSIVDKFKLRYGLVNDRFKNVPGYREACIMEVGQSLTELPQRSCDGA